MSEPVNKYALLCIKQDPRDAEDNCELQRSYNMSQFCPVSVTAFSYSIPSIARCIEASQDAVLRRSFS